MTRPNLDGLITSTDIAKMLGVGRSVVSNYKKRYPEFPEPAYVDSSGRLRLYWREDIEAWIATRFAGEADALQKKADDLERQAAAMRERAQALASGGAP